MAQPEGTALLLESPGHVVQDPVAKPRRLLEIAELDAGWTSLSDRRLDCVIVLAGQARRMFGHGPSPPVPSFNVGERHERPILLRRDG